MNSEDYLLFEKIKEKFESHAKSTNFFTSFDFPYQFDILEITDDSLYIEGSLGFLGSINNFIFKDNINSDLVKSVYREFNDNHDSSRKYSGFALCLSFSKLNKSLYLINSSEFSDKKIVNISYDKENNKINKESCISDEKCSAFFVDVLTSIFKTIAENHNGLHLNEKEISFLESQNLLDSYLKSDKYTHELLALNFDNTACLDIEHMKEANNIVALLKDADKSKKNKIKEKR